MKRIKHLKTMMCITLMALALLVLWSVQKDAKAEGEIGSITINLKTIQNSKGQDTEKGNVEFAAYKVGSWNGSTGKWELDGRLSETKINLDDLTSETATADDLEAAATALLEQENLKDLQVEPDKEHVTDETGHLKFDGLPWGVYLIEQKTGKETYGTVTPLMVTVPYFVNGTRTADIVLDELKASGPYINEAGRIVVTKRTGYIDPTLLEVVELIPSNAVYYVGVFTDAQGEKLLGDEYVKEINMKGVGTGTVEFDKLQKGTYYIFETDKNGKAYKIGEQQPVTVDNPYSWVCNLEEGSSQVVTLDGTAESAPGNVGLYNLYYDLPDGYFYQGSITIGKNVFNTKEKQTTVDDTFYAGIFRDAEGKDLYQVVELVQNGTVTVDVPLGGETGQEPITYYVYETDKDGNRLNKNDFEYKITGEGKVNIEQGKLTSSISLTNTKKKAATDDSDKSDTSDTSKKTSTKKTGDDTPIAFYIVIFVAALAVLVLMTRSRSLKGRNKHE